MAEGEGEAEVSLFFLVVSFFVVALSFLVASDEDFLVEDFFVVLEVFAGDFSGAVVVDVSVLLVQAAMRPAANMTVME
ncbi:MAG TPA: hypothetical protein VLO30_07270 [Chthoniobacterales bacterium]|nr:hypothetical protein [Chthoniobacterales bacterium]